MTHEQMAALEYTIIRFPDATEFAKKAIIYLLRNSNNLTRRVCLSFPPDLYDKLVEQAVFGVHDMLSCNGTTHLGSIFKLMNTDFGIESRGGFFVVGSDHYGVKKRFDSSRGGGTIWVSDLAHDLEAELIAPYREKIESLELKDRLYRINDKTKPQERLVVFYPSRDGAVNQSIKTMFADYDVVIVKEVKNSKRFKNKPAIMVGKDAYVGKKEIFDYVEFCWFE